jgi:hypothetical protein
MLKSLLYIKDYFIKKLIEVIYIYLAYIYTIVRPLIIVTSII